MCSRMREKMLSLILNTTKQPILWSVRIAITTLWLINSPTINDIKLMKELKRKAALYASYNFTIGVKDIPYLTIDISENLKLAYLTGATEALQSQWLLIKQDADGFADEAYLEEMDKSKPFILRYRDGHTEAINTNDEDWSEWYSEVQNHPNRFMWMPIPKYDISEQDEFGSMFEDEEVDIDELSEKLFANSDTLVEANNNALEEHLPVLNMRMFGKKCRFTQIGENEDK